MTPAPQGFLLLTIPNCSISSPYASKLSGLLCLECVTIVVGNPEDRDVWLVLRLDDFEMPISPLVPIEHHVEQITYVFAETKSSTTGQNVVLHLPHPSANQTDLVQDLETFHVLLSQYGIVHNISSTGTSTTSSNDSKNPGILADDAAPGTIVLVDEDDGHILGTLGEGENHAAPAYHVHEDKSVSTPEPGHEKDPVVLDMSSDGGEVVVRRINPNEEGVFAAAGLISRGILRTSTIVASGMTSITDTFVNRTKATEKPLVFSPVMKGHMSRIHRISGKAVEVTTKTTGLINGLVDSLVGAHGKQKDKSTGSKPEKKRKPTFLNRLLLSTDLLLTTVEHVGTQLLDAGSENLARGLGHRYGPDAANAAKTAGSSVKNVALVYIDARGVGRRALLKRAGKGFVKGRLGNGRGTQGGEVVFGEGVEASSSSSRLNVNTPPPLPARSRPTTPTPVTASGMSGPPPLPPRNIDTPEKGIPGGWNGKS